MIAAHTPGAIKKFRRTPWRFQQTVEIPNGLENVERLVATVVGSISKLDALEVVIDEVVFNTTELGRLCHSVNPDSLTRDWSISANTIESIRELLLAAYSDGPDFLCVPTPKPFVLYSDHHLWTTFYANTKSNLNQIITPLSAAGFKLIDNWTREL